MHEVDELDGDREVGDRDEEVADELPPRKRVVDGPIHLSGLVAGEWLGLTTQYELGRRTRIFLASEARRRAVY